MKKELCQTAAAGLGILFCACMPARPALAQTAEHVELTSFSGNVKILLDGAADYADAQEGMILESGDQVTAAAGSSAELSFNEENTNLIRLNEDTSIRISLSGEEKLEMTQGEVFSSISSLPSGTAFEIRTPTAISGARGTDWITKVSGDETDVEAIDDEPYVRHMDETTGTFAAEMTRIQPGQMTTVKKFRKPSEFRPIAPERRQHWQTIKHDLRNRGNDAMQKRMTRPRFDRKEFIERHQGNGRPGRGNPQIGQTHPFAHENLDHPRMPQSRGDQENKPRGGNHPLLKEKHPPAAQANRQFNGQHAPGDRPNHTPTEKKSPQAGMKKPPASHNQPGAQHDRAAQPPPRKTGPRKAPGHTGGARK